MAQQLSMDNIQNILFLDLYSMETVLICDIVEYYLS